MIKDYRSDFPILKRKIHGKRLAYLDSAGTSQIPKYVLDGIYDFETNHRANVHRGVHTLSEEASVMYENARLKVSKFIGAVVPSEVVFTSGTTESINTVAFSWGFQNLKKGDIVLVSEIEHHSNLVPWQEVCRMTGSQIKYIPVDNSGDLDIKNTNVDWAKVKLVAFTQVSNVLGRVNEIRGYPFLGATPMPRILVDGSQAVSHLPINVQSFGIDFYAFSGHKMYGPTGIGVLYGKKRLLEQLNPFQYGGGMIREVTFEYATWNDLPWKFEAGTPPIAEAIGLSAAVGYLTAQGMQHLKEHEQQLTQYTLQKLSEIQGLTIVGPGTTKHRGPLISFTLQGLHPHDVSELLDREGIAVRGGHHCAMPLLNLLGLEGVTRVSLAIYNTKDDIDQLFEAIHKAVRIFQ